MAKRTIAECDYPQCKDWHTKTYSIAVDDAASELDLCDEHSTPLLELYSYGRVKRRPGRKPGQKDGLAAMVVKPARKAAAQPRTKVEQIRVQSPKTP